jgi:hypothetical protein
MKYLLILFCFCLLVSCKKDVAYFQQSAYSSYLPSKKNIKIQPNITQPDIQLSASLDNATIISTEPKTSENLILEVDPINVVELHKSKIKKRIIQQKKIAFYSTNTPIAVNYHKNFFKRNPKEVPLNSTIYTGLIIFGIAILLALVSLNSLSLLFGLAAILFLYLGFKSYFRKQRRRDFFRK